MFLTVSRLDTLFCQITTFIKVHVAFFFWASDPLINRFYGNLSLKGSEAQKHRPHKLIWTLWFDEKSISNILITKNFTHFSVVKIQLYLRIWLETKLWTRKLFAIGLLQVMVKWTRNITKVRVKSKFKNCNFQIILSNIWYKSSSNSVKCVPNVFLWEFSIILL